LGGAKISVRNGITVDYGALSFALDPKGPSRSDYTFVSHAHMDHVQTPAPDTRVLASRETRMLAQARGFDLGRTAEGVDDVRLLDSGHILVLMGYALGKSQVLSHLFSSWSPFYVHARVAEMNEVYRSCGVDLRKGRVVGPELEGVSTGPWVMVAPMMSPQNAFAKRLKKEFGAAFAAFSGWAADPGYARSIGADFAFPVSDHCDYQELLTLVREVSPETVYTTHGFTSEFALDLRKLGFDAKPLNGYQAFLSEY